MWKFEEGAGRCSIIDVIFRGGYIICVFTTNKNFLVLNVAFMGTQITRIIFHV